MTPPRKKASALSFISPKTPRSPREGFPAPWGGGAAGAPSQLSLAASRLSVQGHEHGQGQGQGLLLFSPGGSPCYTFAVMQNEDDANPRTDRLSQTSSGSGTGGGAEGGALEAATGMPHGVPPPGILTDDMLEMLQQDPTLRRVLEAPDGKFHVSEAVLAYQTSRDGAPLDGAPQGTVPPDSGATNDPSQSQSQSQGGGGGTDQEGEADGEDGARRGQGLRSISYSDLGVGDMDGEEKEEVRQGVLEELRRKKKRLLAQRRRQRPLPLWVVRSAEDVRDLCIEFYIVR